MKKIIMPGRVKVGKHLERVFVKVEIDEKGRLSISGVVGPRPTGNCRGNCGQIDMSIKPADLIIGPDWTRGRVELLWKVWELWHLNDLRAACVHQSALGWTYETHPMAPCPECGYKLGSERKKEKLPSWVVEFVNGLPETKEIPAWV
jgi:hypothetical protein